MNVTQEDLNAVRQLMRTFRALEKFEPILQKVLVAEEQISRLQVDRNTALKELDEAVAQAKAAKASHRAELSKMADEKEARAKVIKREIEADRQRALDELAQEVLLEKKKVESAKKEVVDERARHATEMEHRGKELKEIGERIAALRKEESGLKSLIEKLAETRDKHKKEIGSLLDTLKADAEQ